MAKDPWIGRKSVKKCRLHIRYFFPPSPPPPHLLPTKKFPSKSFLGNLGIFFPADVDFFPPSEDGEKWDRIEVFFRQLFFYLVISFSLFFSEKNGTYGKTGVAFRPVGNATRIIPIGKKSPEAKLLLTSTKDPVALYVMIRSETFSDMLWNWRMQETWIRKRSNAETHIYSTFLKAILFIKHFPDFFASHAGKRLTDIIARASREKGRLRKKNKKPPFSEPYYTMQISLPLCFVSLQNIFPNFLLPSKNGRFRNYFNDDTFCPLIPSSFAHFSFISTRSQKRERDVSWTTTVTVGGPLSFYPIRIREEEEEKSDHLLSILPT